MNNLSEILNNKRFTQTQSKRPVNLLWEEAEQFAKYVGLPTTFVLRLFRIYGKSEVLKIRSWLFDCPYDAKRGGKIALATWKLKENKKIKDELLAKKI